jgi:hypothetical protein
MSEAVPQSPQMQDLLLRLNALESAMLEQDPRMKDHLKEIHKNLIQYEELVHLLDEEQIGKIMQAQQLITNTTLVSSMTTKSGKAAAAKKSAGLTLGDL